MDDLSLEADDAGEAAGDAEAEADAGAEAVEVGGAEAAPPPPARQVRAPFTDALEAGGVLDALAEAIVEVYTNPKAVPELFNSFLTTMGVAEQGDIDKILIENQELRRRKEDLKKQIAGLEARARK